MLSLLDKVYKSFFSNKFILELRPHPFDTINSSNCPSSQSGFKLRNNQKSFQNQVWRTGEWATQLHWIRFTMTRQGEGFIWWFALEVLDHCRIKISHSVTTNGNIIEISVISHFEGNAA